MSKVKSKLQPGFLNYLPFLAAFVPQKLAHNFAVYLSPLPRGGLPTLGE